MILNKYNFTNLFNLLPPEHSIYAQIRFKLTGHVNYHIFDPKQKSHHHALETY